MQYFRVSECARTVTLIQNSTRLKKDYMRLLRTLQGI